MHTPKSWPVLVLSLLLAVGGCSGSGLVKVTGKVTYHGQPVPSTEVRFFPADGGRASSGLTDDNGKFTLRFSRQDPGCTLGPHTVTLKYHVSSEELTHKIPPKASSELKEIIAKYGMPQDSPLHYEVKKNGDFFDIQIE